MQLEDGMLAAFGLYLLRTSALVLAAPLIGAASGFSGFRLGLIGVLTLVMYLSGGIPLDTSPDVLTYALLAARELLVGLSLAFVLHLVVMAVQVAGHLIGHEMAFNMSSQADPVTGVSVPLIAFFYETVFMLILLSVNGHLWLVRALAESYDRAPVGDMNLNAELGPFTLNLFGELFAAGMTFAAPVFVLLGLVSVLLALLTKAVPQINIMEFGFSLRIGTGFLAMTLFAPLIEPASKRLLDLLMQGLNGGLDALGG